MSINFSELRTIHEEAEVEGEGRSASATAGARSNGHGQHQPHSPSSNLGRFVSSDQMPAPAMQIDPALISPERRGHAVQSSSRDASYGLAGTKRTYAERLSVTPAPGGQAANHTLAFASEAGYARIGNEHGNGHAHGYHDDQDGDEDDGQDDNVDNDDDEDDGEYDDEGDMSGYGLAGYAEDGEGRGHGRDANGDRGTRGLRGRGTSEDDARLASGSSSDRTPTGVNANGRAGEDAGDTQSRKKAKARESMTCDNCRKRKIKCKEDTDPYADPLDKSCDGCRKLGIECTYDYVRKKPGRKNGFVIKMRAAQEAALRGETTHSPTLNSSLLGSVGSSNMSHNFSGGSVFSPSTSTSTSEPARPKPRAKRPKATPYPSFPVPLIPPLPANPFDPGSSSSHPAQPPRPMSSFAFSPKTNSFSSGSGSDAANAFGTGSGTGLEWLDSMLEGTAMGSLGSTGMEGFNWDQANLLAYESPEHALMNIGTGSTATPQFGSGSSSSTFGPPSFSSGPTTVPGGNIGMGIPGAMAHAASLHSAIKAEPQLEDVTSWANISHFISLFLQYLYPLLPLVHRPTFAEHLATRRDLRDTDFRALLLSIVAYVISQLPTSRLVNDQFDIEGLKRLQRRCHRTCKALQRTYYGPTNLTQISTIIFDMFYLLSIGLGHTAGARLGQAVQLAFSMGMNSDERTAALGLDAIEIQLRRRVFWQLYASDKTRAIPGPPMLINDFQGVCSLPSPIDDEFITSQGMFPQPSHRTSILSGFVIVSQLFRILSECFFHHRCVATGFKGIGINWTIEAEERLHRVLKDMPLAIQDPEGHGGGHQVGLVGLNGILGQNGQGGGGDGGKGVFAMQRANVLITAAITKFALSDLRAALNIKTDQLAKEREAVAREVHLLLMNIPVEDLASNGESMRGKVFHIACALCAQVGGGVDERGQELIKDWCNMFSAITFVQMPPPPPEENLDSRSNTPPQSALRS